jgi:hypothetical protein
LRKIDSVEEMLTGEGLKIGYYLDSARREIGGWMCVDGAICMFCVEMIGCWFDFKWLVVRVLIVVGV